MFWTCTIASSVKTRLGGITELTRITLTIVLLTVRVQCRTSFALQLLTFVFATGQTLYYSTNYPRLSSLKEQFDPHDIFSFPHSIEE